VGAGAAMAAINIADRQAQATGVTPVKGTQTPGHTDADGSPMVDLAGDGSTPESAEAR
jgi:hypothetical protein